MNEDQDWLRDAYVEQLINGVLSGSETLSMNVHIRVANRQPAALGEKVLEEHGPDGIIREAAQRIYDRIDGLAERGKTDESQALAREFGNPEMASEMILKQAGKVAADLYFERNSPRGR